MTPHTTDLGSSSPVTDTADLSIDSVAENLAIAMAEDWRAGRRRSVEDVLAEQPGLSNQSQVVVRLIYEEICLRQEENAGPTSIEIYDRFPRYKDELQAILSGHRLFESENQPTTFPGVGGTLGDARLLTELGRGALGRVFLATQPALADRPIVLKVIPSRGDEHLTLARLQHTHIVPLYAAQVFPDLGLRALFMPYMGSLTLARLSEALKEIPLEARTGASILEALDRSSDLLPIDVPRGGSARAWLGRSSYTQAIAWIAACLVRALQHAHERGLVHLDLKPSNVLIAADGQPMLLDFHLARSPIQANDPAPGMMGGTPSYMSPEQADALAQIRLGQAPQTSVEAQSDLYSLGVVLYEMLGGTLPPPSSSRLIVKQLRQANRRVSACLAELVARTMAQNPSDRYADASALVEDLRRYLADLPLRGVSDRDPIERWRRWRRRRPHALALMTMVASVIAAAVLVVIAARGTGVVSMDIEATRQAGRERRRESADQLATAVAGLQKQITDAKDTPPDMVADGVLADLIHVIWSERKKFLDSRDGLLSEVIEQGIRADLKKLLALSILQDQRARKYEVKDNRQIGLRRIDEARSELGTSDELEALRSQLLRMPIPTPLSSGVP